MEEFSGMKSYEEFRNELGRLSSRDSVVKLVSFLEEEKNRDPSEVIEAALEILRLNADRKICKSEEKAISYLSKAYFRLGGYEQSANYLREIFSRWGDSLSKREEADYLSRLGVIYSYLGDYDAALENMIDSLRRFEELGDKTRIADLQCNVSMVFMEIDELEKSEAYMREALEFAENSGSEEQRAAFLNNLALLLYRREKKHEALGCLLKSAEIKENQGDSSKLMTTFLNIATAYEEMGEHTPVIGYIEKAMELAEMYRDTECCATCFKQLGVHLTNRGEYDRAETYLKKALKLLEGTSFAKRILGTLRELSTLFEKKGDYRQALRYMKEQTECERRVFSEEKARKIAHVSSLYEAKKKTLEAELLRERTDELTRLNKEISEQYRDLKAAEGALKQANKKLQQKMEVDPLTGLLNNQRIYEKIQSLIDHSTANDEPLSIVMFDLDHFKQLNDKNGHPVGNKALAKVARTIKENIRDHDLAFRFGGEEFLVLLTGRGRDVAVRVAERIRKAVEKMSFHESLKITVSGGAKQLANENAHELVVEADRLLYEAKRLGRNRTMY